MNQPYLTFSATPGSIAAEAERLVTTFRRRRDALAERIEPEEAAFANVMLPLAHMQNEFTVQSRVLSFFRHASEDADIRAASASAQTLFDDFHAECWMREDIFRLVDIVHRKSEELAPESKLFLETSYHRFVRSGLGIRNVVSRGRLKQIQGRLSTIHAEFRENIGSQKDEISFMLAELEGVPESTIAHFQHDTETDMVRIDLANPAHRTILSSASKSATRRRLYLASESRCKANLPLVKEAVGLRHEMAKLMGFENYAASQLQSRMAKTPRRVNEFLSDLRSKLVPYGVAALQELKDLKKADKNKDDDANSFFLWDYNYYHRQSLKSLSSADRSRIREYFPLQATLGAILDLFGKLFGIVFDEIKASHSQVWHPDVQVFEVCESEARGGGFLGLLYLDLFRRDGKYPHESCFNLQPGFAKRDGSRWYPSTALLCSFPKPTTDKPSLLSHFEVTTLLHEPGHGIHDLVSKTQYAQFHGPEGVPVDFGELPSQFLEYWSWMPSQLQSLSRHYSYLGPDMLAAWQEQNPGETQPPVLIPEDLIGALTAASRSTFGPLFHLDQVHRASFDMAIHQPLTEGAEDIDITTLWNKSRKEIGLIDGAEIMENDYLQCHGYTTTTHLMQADYAAGYYAYLYSEVYAADLFYSEFQQDPLDADKFQRYRLCVLESGGSRDGFQNLVDFLGREPSAGAFYRALLN